MDDFRVLLLDEQGKPRAASDRGVNYTEAGQLARWLEKGGHGARVVPNGKRFESPKVIKFYTPQLHSATCIAMPEAHTWADKQVQVEFPIGESVRPEEPKRTWLRSLLGAVSWFVFGG